MDQVSYAFYPTLLDSFVYYKKTEELNKFVELIDKINRVKVERHNGLSKGIAFENVINNLIDNRSTVNDFNLELVHSIVSKLKRCTSKQKKLETVIDSPYGKIKLYGIFDYEFPQMYADLKTTENYSFGKYDDHIQHKMCSLICKNNGAPIEQFNYVITDFKYWYIENYKCTDSLHDDLMYEIYDFISFINHYKHLITNNKIFGGDGVNEIILS
ncbi:hypothetical protein G7074_18020 [Pedobacter sp. HDW13]|uniref:hypothetical protein n=1 Tax=Pedobacter sp. HDW13 TaxID=2714940 RepID=UPI0014089906|nr:hypothetical protein [Pedobacter sp. HDW13]QIL40996.1 hypothetical protein G7074_18020 [Pedobacter sp. HDW13]